MKHLDLQAEKVLLALLYAINLISVFGFVVFTLNPSSLVRWPWAAPIYSMSYLVFAQLQIVTAFLAMVCALLRHAGFRWILAFMLIAALSAGSELLGTSYGIPFGPYSYTHLLGPKLLDRVPYLIPLSWFFMSLPAYWLAYKILPSPRLSSVLARIIMGSLLLLSWDLTLDPAMSFLTPFWVWGEVGLYYGMPFSNLVGWFVTGILLMAILEMLNAIAWLKRVPARFLALFYIANLFLPFAMVLFAGLYKAAIVTLAVGALYLCIYSFQQKRGGMYAWASTPT
jgi:uncharacterized membrane protein